MKEFGGEIGQKYAKIDLTGRKAVIEGEFAEHTGWPESLRNRFNTAILFDEMSGKEVKTRVLDKIDQLSKRLGISMSLAERDFPLHSTVLEAVAEEVKGDSTEEAAKKRDAFFSKLSQAETAKKSEQSLTGQEIEYKYILIDKENILLTATDIPEVVVSVRDELDRWYKSESLKTLPMKNILHCTLGRIAKLPTDKAEREQVLNQYKDELVRLRHEISKNPLRLKVANLHRGDAYNFINITAE